MPRRRKKKNTMFDRDEKFYQTVENNIPHENIVVNNISGKEKVTNRIIKIRRMQIAIGIPLDEVLFTKWFSNFTHLQIMPWDYILTSIGTYIKLSRNLIHNNYIKYCDNCKYLVMLDSDVLPPPDFIDRLIAHKLPFVGGWYRKKGEPYHPCVYNFDNIDEHGVYNYKIIETPGKGLQKVDAAGAGCWLMRRDVALALGENPYELDTGEDLELCRKVKQAGFDVYIDWDLACAHCGVAII